MSLKSKKTRDDICYMDDEQVRDLLMRLESCDEAINIFDELVLCPVCGACIDIYGIMTHKDPKIYKCN